MIKLEVKTCPVCLATATIADVTSGHHYRVECNRCGTYDISNTAEAILSAQHLNDDTEKAAVGHWLQYQHHYTPVPKLSADQLEQLTKALYFPSVEEQLDLLLEHIGEIAGSLGVKVELDDVKCQYIYGGRSPANVHALINYLTEQHLLETSGSYGRYGTTVFNISLTVHGWLEVEKIKSGKVSGKKAFMAMPFNKHDLEEKWLPVLRQAVSETGFDLQRVDDEPEPGLIDTKMRLQIKTARFLIVELTHANSGAYWEGGYAEGLEKPVIYTCKKGEKTHFDVEHSFRIEWDPENMEPALSTLKATIRNTLPDAKLEDL